MKKYSIKETIEITGISKKRLIHLIRKEKKRAGLVLIPKYRKVSPIKRTFFSEYQVQLLKISELNREENELINSALENSHNIKINLPDGWKIRR